MKLKKLLKDIPVKQIKGSKDIEIAGICANSKLVSPGSLFIAKRGKIDDGNKYTPEAIEAGAAAILSDIYDPSFKNVTQIIVDDVNAIEGENLGAILRVPKRQAPHGRHHRHKRKDDHILPCQTSPGHH